MKKYVLWIAAGIGLFLYLRSRRTTVPGVPRPGINTPPPSNVPGGNLPIVPLTAPPSETADLV